MKMPMWILKNATEFQAEYTMNVAMWELILPLVLMLILVFALWANLAILAIPGGTDGGGDDDDDPPPRPRHAAEQVHLAGASSNEATNGNDAGDDSSKNGGSKGLATNVGGDLVDGGYCTFASLESDQQVTTGGFLGVASLMGVSSYAASMVTEDNGRSTAEASSGSGGSTLSQDNKGSSDSNGSSGGSTVSKATKGIEANMGEVAGAGASIK